MNNYTMLTQSLLNVHATTDTTFIILDTDDNEYELLMISSGPDEPVEIHISKLEGQVMSGPKTASELMDMAIAEIKAKSDEIERLTAEQERDRAWALQQYSLGQGYTMSRGQFIPRTPPPWEVEA